MKTAIASEEKNIEEAKVSPISGRASYYHIYEDKKHIKTIKNPFKIGGGGAGPSVAQMLINENIDLVISGKFGEKMLNVFEENNIKTKISKEILIKDLI